VSNASDTCPEHPVATGQATDRLDSAVRILDDSVTDPDSSLSGLLEGLRPTTADAPVQAHRDDEAVQPQERRGSGDLHVPSGDTAKKTDKRVNDILLGPLERPALQWLCQYMPGWVTPDILTAIGVLGGVIIAAGYWLSNVDKNFLWLVDFGYVVNWFGDSLDGNLARYRKIERFKYGYFLDHTVDTLTQTIVCIGLGLSPFVDFGYAMLGLASYLQLGILTYVRTAVTGVFKVSYGKIGPTEVRVLVIGVNTVFYFSSNPMLHLPVITISLFNFIILCLAVAFFIHYIVATLQQAAVLNKQDRAQGHSSRAQ